MMRWTIARGVFAAAFLAAALPAAAFAGPGFRACAADREAFCPDARGPREVGECLREHEAELSAECLAVHQHKEACRAEVEALCPDLSGAEFRDCIVAHRDEISDDCRPRRHHDKPCDFPG
jgi:hypothetical protein